MMGFTVQRTAALEPLAASSDLPNVPVSARMSLDVLNGPSSSPELGLFFELAFPATDQGLSQHDGFRRRGMWR